MGGVTPPDDFGEFDLEPSLLMPAAGEILTKGHQPDKGDETEEGLRIGIFTYTPSP